MMMLSKVAEVLGGQLIGNDVEFNAVSTDTRAIKAGELFVALRGDKFDGSQFVKAAAESGAVAALMNADSYQGVAMPCALVLVKDTRLALGKLAAHWRDQFEISLIGVTGSNGKTTVKEMLAAILREAAGHDDAVLATEGNFNNDIGMPLTLLKLRKQHRYAVIEMGMNHSGEIEYLTHLARPDVAIINNAGNAHIANLGSLEAIAQAKGEIFSGLKKQGIAIINADENFAPMWRKLAANHKVLEFALEASAAISAKTQVIDYIQLIEISTPLGNFKTTLNVPGEHNVRNALAATAAAVALNIAPEVMAASLKKFSGVSGRLQRKSARNGATIIDDSYNANPASLRAAIKVLVQSPGQKILVMGDMGELGAEAETLHKQMGEEARELGVDKLLALGELSQFAVDAFGAGSQHFDSIQSLLDELKRELGTDSTVLVKGSRFMKMERVVKELVDVGSAHSDADEKNNHVQAGLQAQQVSRGK